MKGVTRTDIEGFLSDLVSRSGALDPEALRLTLASNNLEIVRAGVPVSGDLLDQLEPYIQKVRVGNGPLQDGVLIDDLEEE